MRAALAQHRDDLICAAGLWHGAVTVCLPAMPIDDLGSQAVIADPAGADHLPRQGELTALFADSGLTSSGVTLFIHYGRGTFSEEVWRGHGVHDRRPGS